jgi:hypothetical protein
MSAAKARCIPLVVTLGGGYGDPISRTARAHANTFQTSARVFGCCHAAIQRKTAGDPEIFD